MTKAELESKPLSELHALAAEAGVEKYRMLSKAELAAALSDGDADGAGSGGGSRSGGSAPSRSSSESRERSSSSRRRRRRPPREREERTDEADEGEPEKPSGAAAAPEPAPPEPAPAAAGAAPAPESSRPRRRRRRRFGRRGKDGVTVQDLLLPPEAGRQAILAAATREACTTLLRGVAADLAAASKGPDPVVLLIDPGPEELADWKREAPQAEIVAAGQARHATDALAQAVTRAGSGEDIFLLVDSLTRLATDFGDTDTAKEFFDAGRAQGAAGGGSLTIVAAIERS
ncbi:MAG TPA: Rho termination factor N-terminal domain-containing protein [Solirubrobacterales bacterium]|nr:Rho termination factor N-terminal domain-containing protein [Solirubrobacterales bacterium]